MKKIAALLLAAGLAVSMTACASDAPVDTTATEATVPPTEVPAPATYTYNEALSVFPSDWNPHTSVGASGEKILSYITDSFYRFDFNETGDGSVLVCAMAAGDPVDITGDYVGSYGISQGDSARVYRIDLRDDLKWEDGTAITAYDFVESARRLLDPAAQNRQGDSLYTGEAVIYNAKNYQYQEKHVTLQDNRTAPERYTMEDLTRNENGVYETPQGETVYIALDVPLDWLAGRTLTESVEAYGTDRYAMYRWNYLTGRKERNGCAPLTVETLSNLTHVICDNPANGETAADVANYLVYGYTYPALSWEEVGIFALSRTQLVYVLEEPLSGFRLKNSLPGDYLVNIALYDACAATADGVYTNSYGTSVETTMSYGPYRLTGFQQGSQFILEKNGNYYGLTADTYQTTRIVVDCVPEAAVRLELLNQGKLDTYSLSGTDMQRYSQSKYCHYNAGSFTFAMAFNPESGSILSVPEFRMAMSAALDRAAFCLAVSPTSMPACGLYSPLFLADPQTGTAYRATAEGQQALASATGYDPEKARVLFNTAYDKALAAGLMTGEDLVEIRVGTPNATSDFYNSGYDFLVSSYTEAVRGTRLEGKLTFTRDDTLGDGCPAALRDNQVDMLFGVCWPGSTLDPYRLMEAYISDEYRFDQSTDYSSVMLDIEIGGTVVTASVKEWYDTLSGTPETDPASRLRILAKLEEAVLNNGCFIPLMNDAAPQLTGMQVSHPIDTSLFGLGLGGIRYLTYVYSDAEWEAYVESQGGTLDYQ